MWLFLFVQVANASEGFYSVSMLGQSQLPIDLKVPDKFKQYGFYGEIDKESVTKHFGVGYRFNEYMAVEGFYNDLGTYTACVNHPLVGRVACANASAESYSIGILFGYGPLYGRVDYHKAYGELYYLNVIEKYSAAAPTAGLGLRFQIYNDIYFRYEYRVPSVPQHLIGLEMRF